MTLCAAWVRRANTNGGELVLATDSRLSGGESWDACPKIMTLPRSDAAICFTGSTLRAYPLMLQLYSSVESFPDSRRRILDFDAMKGHTVRIFNDMLRYIKPEVPGDEEALQDELANCKFLIGGYSWNSSRFRVICVDYDKAAGQFKASSLRVKDRTFAFVGDADTQRGISLPVLARRRTFQLLRQRGKLTRGVDLDWEPFEVLRDLVLENKHRTIGGAAQVTKLYRHLNCQRFAVYWPSRENGQLTIAGRPSLDYEETDWPRLDAQTLEVSTIKLRALNTQ